DADAQIAGGSQFHSEAETPAVDAGDDRYREHADRLVGDVRERVFDFGLLRRQIFHFRQVRAGDERLVARTGDHRRAPRLVLGQLIEGVGDGALARHAQGIALVRIVDGDPGDVAGIAAVFSADLDQIRRCWYMHFSFSKVRSSRQFNLRRT